MKTRLLAYIFILSIIPGLNIARAHAVKISGAGNAAAAADNRNTGPVASAGPETLKPPSSNANLANLALSKGALSPAFATGTLAYTDMVSNGNASVTVKPTTADPTATVTVNGTAVASGSASGAIALSVGSNTITTIVTAQDGVTTQTYTVNVIRPSLNAKLLNLKISSGTLTPVFANGTTSYTASVTNATASITLTPTTEVNSATVTVNGAAVTSGTASGAIALAVGTNTITTVVTAQDGVTTDSYTVTVTRAALSNNANLANLSISKGALSPAFAAATLSYTDLVSNGNASVTVKPTTADPTATVTVNGTAIASGSASGAIALNVGANTISIVVTAQDGVTTQTYTVIVTRPSTNAKLASLTMSSGTLAPVFNTNTTGYAATVTNATASITVTPTTAVNTATVTVNGTAVISGSSSGAIALSIGANTITIVVTAQDGVTTDTYTVTVTRNVAAGTYTWTGAGANSNWSNNNNWSPSSGHPIAGDTAAIGTTANLPTVDASSACSAVTITGTTTLTLSASLNVSGGITLNGPLTTSGAAGSIKSNSLTINAGEPLINSSPFTVAGGNVAIASNGSISNQAGGTFKISSSPSINMLDNSSITNAGIFNISTSSIQMGKSGFINNIAGGTFTINNSSTIGFASNLASSASIQNSGTFYAGTSGSSCNINLNYTNTAITNTGSFYLGSTSVINLTGNSANISNTGTFTLQSDINGCATIGKITGASAACTGTYNVERYLTGGSSAYRGYRLLSSPVNAGTVNGNTVYSINYTKLSCYLTGTTGTAGGFDAGVNPTMYLYRENIKPSNVTFTSGNFRGINDITTPPTYALDGDGSGFNIPIGNGLYFFFRGDRNVASLSTETITTYVPTSTTLTATGALNQGQVVVKDWYTPASPNLGFTNTAGNASVQGFNFVGNPYPSSINWDQLDSLSSTTGIYVKNVTPTVYVLDSKSQNFNTYQAGNGGVGTIAGTGSNVLPSGQAFFVRATSAAAQLIFNESAKINSQATAAIGNLFLGAPPQAVVSQYLNLKLMQDSVNMDGLIINFNSSAKPEYAAGKDAAYKPGYGTASLSALSAGDAAVAISTLPLPKLEQTVIKLNVTAKTDGIYRLNMAAVKSVPSLYDIWLMDAYKKDSLDIRHHPAYNFNIDKGDSATFGPTRFSLVIRQNPALMVHLLSFTGAKSAGGAQIVWKTDNEENYTNFTVERSSDGGAVFTVLGGLTSSAQGTYSLFDKNPPVTTDKYRLKIQDLNGTITYSNIVTLIYGNALTAAGGDIRIYPNPADNIINLAINQTSGNLTAGNPALQSVSLAPGYAAITPGGTGPYDIKIINITGLVIKTATSSTASWQNNISDLAPGTYIVQVLKNSDKSLVGKSTFVKL